jgi:hypothetical protein
MQNYNLVHSEQYKGHKITIERDEYAESPNEWLNDDTFLVYDHRDFFVERKGFNPEHINEQVVANKRMFFEGYFVFPVYAYIHSGVSLSLHNTGYPFNCRWDTSLRGFVLVKREKRWSYTRKKAQQVAQGQIDTWNKYLSGEVYSYSIEKDGQITDSCGGFYDSIAEVLKEARGIVDASIQLTVKSHCNKLKEWIKAKVNISYRKSLKVTLGY